MEPWRRRSERFGTQRHAARRRYRLRCHRTMALALLTLVATLAIAPIAQASVTPGAQTAASATLSASGSFATNGGNGLTTAAVSLAHAGDVLVIWVKSRFGSNPAIQVTNVSSSGSGAIGSPVNAIQYYTVDHPNNDDEIWYAPVTAAGSITLTFAWSGNNSSDFSEYSTQEFQPSTPSVYSIDTTNHLEINTSSTSMQFPSLTPVGASELYAGYNSNNGPGSYGAPTTSGYSADVTADQDVILVNSDVSSSTQSPSTTATGQAATQSSIGALIIATAATQYTVTFNGNGSTGGTMNPESAYSPTALTTNAFAKTGYTFSGWNTAANGSGTSYADRATYPFSAAVTLYAQWTADYYSVTFNGNGSTSGNINPETANTSTALATNAFVKAGYTFSGWNTAANGSGTSYADRATYPFTAAVTLYAQWIVTLYAVTFNGNGSTSGTMSTESANTPTALTPNAFFETNYTFSGWNTAANGSGTSYPDGAAYSFTAPVTLYAQWTADYFSVTFHGNRSTRGSMRIQFENAPTALPTNAFVRTGYTFVGWNTAANGSGTHYANRASFPFKVRAALYAQWRAIVPHAWRVIGSVIVGETRHVTIRGTGFSKGSHVKSNDRGTTVSVLRASTKELLLVVTVRKGSSLGRHTFSIVTASKKTCKLYYVAEK